MEIDLRNPQIARWEIDRKLSVLTILKIVAASVILPCFIFLVFTILWQLGTLIGHSTVVFLSCLLECLLIVTLCHLAWDRFLGDQSVSYQAAVLGSLNTIVLFGIVSLLTYLTPFLIGVLDQTDRHYALPDWYFTYGDLLSYGLLSKIAGNQTASPGPGTKVVLAVLGFLLNATVITTVVNLARHSILRKERITGTQLELWTHLLSPVYWLEDFKITLTTRLIEVDTPSLSLPPAGHEFYRRQVVSVGKGQQYPLKQLRRYLVLPWVTLFTKFTSRNQPFSIEVHEENGTWLIKDRDLPNVPFAEGMPNMIELASRYICNAPQGFTLRISSADFFGASIVLSLEKEVGEWAEYHWNVWGVAGEQVLSGRMLRPLLERKFKSIPQKIYVQALPGNNS